MPSTELLARLSALAGILPEYVDNWQQRHRTTPETQRALLTAMGIEHATPQQMAAAIEEHQLRPWRRPLEPVTVVRSDEAAATLRLVCTDAQAVEPFAWRLYLEQGGEQKGEFRPQALHRLESRQVDGVPCSAWRLQLPDPLPPGYHRLELLHDGKTLAQQSLIVAPPTCYRPAALDSGGRLWGTALQLYALRSERNWGMGDFTDLRRALEFWAAQGAEIIGINPVHALFPHNPEHASPYSPSSRLFFNVLYLDVEAVADFHECEAARALLRTPESLLRLEALRAAELVDYSSVATLKLQLLERLYRHFRDHHLAPGSERAAAFHAFQQREGERLYTHTLFEALQEHFHHQDPAVWGWPVWPADYRDPAAAAVRQFASQHGERIEFFAYLQWQADLQLANVGQRSLELGLGVGLYLDLAVSIDGGGAEAWANQALYAIGVGVGAPPELNNQLGQDWGLPPFVPERLREAAYAPFIATLRHNMRHAGALRLDHVMGLFRQFWVPAGMAPAQGAYVRYPFAELLGILALESQRNHCLVIGEDLGTVPEEVRDALAPIDILSYRLLILEKEPDGSFVPPADYPAQALAAVTTHDLPTLAGYWEGRDIQRRSELQLYGSAAARRTQLVTRAEERAYLLLALEQSGLLPEGVGVTTALPAVTPEFARAVHLHLARSPARVLMVQIEDMLGVQDQINIPATTTQHPNWRRKLPANLESFPGDLRLLALAAALREERPRARSVVPRERRLPIPLATYRLQLSRDFTFAQATQLVPYLAQLGITHVYCSPYLKARPGSPHGYDIVDHNALNPEIGTTADFDAFCAALKAHEMGQILDLVPNHMGVMGADNLWWLDVLENGPASPYASFFDIDWQPLKEELRGKVLLPILEHSYGEMLESGQLQLAYDEAGGTFSVWYHQHRLPIGPRGYPRLLRHRLALLEAQLPPDSHDLQELTSIITAFDNLPPREATEPEKIVERHRDRELLMQRLATLAQEVAPIRQMILETVTDYNGRAGEPDSFGLLHALLEEQAWRIANWRAASDDINYRRFFDINDLAALRMEDSRVFEATHQLVLELIGEDKVQGLRIDHPDGLFDPDQYFRRLQERVALRTPPMEGGKALYLLAEKILADHESLREEWAIHGTTGYDFCNLLNGLFVDPRAEAALERAYRSITRDRHAFDEVIYRSKHLIMKYAMASELTVLAGQLSRICELRPHTRDFTANNLRYALAEVIASLPVYRTYVRDGQVTPLDRRYVEWAVARAKKLNKPLNASIFDFLAEVLLLDAAQGREPAYSTAITAFAMHFQQLTGPVMAKGVEDTAFYAHHRLISLNEVGGDPRRFGVSVKAFHAENSKRRERWPHAMLNTTTHDSKRSEDVRARINVLSEIPELWHEQVMRWRRLNRNRKTQLEGEAIPSAGDEYLLYQTLIGIWPLGDLALDAHEAVLQRIEGYMLKAVREAKQHTSWLNPNAPYEEQLAAFIKALLNPVANNTFLGEFLPFQRRVAYWGMFNSLSQTLLKLTSPGMPDIYQGNELWEFCLVDPDNRRPVNYPLRQQLLAEMQVFDTLPVDELAQQLRQMLEQLSDGRAKLYLTWRLLQIRSLWPHIFQEGDYLPLEPSGALVEHLCAFARRCDDTTLVAVAPRWYVRLAPEPGHLPLGVTVWGDTVLRLDGLEPGASGTNLLTGEHVEVAAADGHPTLPLATLLENFPVALLRF